MRALIPHTFRTSETLDVDRMNDNFRALGRNLDDVARRRYTHSTMRKQWTAISNTHSDMHRELRFSPPFDVEIVAIEIIAYGTDGATITFTNTANVTGFRDQEITCAGATTRKSFEGLVAAPTSARVASGADARIGWSVDTGTYTIDRLDLLLHVRTDQHAAGLPEFDPAMLDASSTNTTVTLNAEFTTWGVQHGLETSRDEQRTIEIVELPSSSGGAIPSYDTDHLIFQGGRGSGGRTLNRVQVYGVTDNSRGIQVLVQDESSATQATLSATTLTDTKPELVGNADLDDTQTDDPLDATSDWHMVVSTLSGSGELTGCYAVLYFD